ncbi:MAG: nuclear transport factor 2 family protein [Bacteroidota bacterium]
MASRSDAQPMPLLESPPSKLVTENKTAEATIHTFVQAWGAAWSPKEKTATFTKASFAPYYLQSERLLAFDYTDANTRTVIKGAKLHHQMWAPFVQSFTYWSFTPRPQSIAIYALSAEGAVVALYVDMHGVKKDGTAFNGTAHATLALEKVDGQWKIAHENIWGPIKE